MLFVTSVLFCGRNSCNASEHSDVGRRQRHTASPAREDSDERGRGAAISSHPGKPSRAAVFRRLGRRCPRHYDAASPVACVTGAAQMLNIGT